MDGDDCVEADDENVDEDEEAGSCVAAMGEAVVVDGVDADEESDDGAVEDDIPSVPAAAAVVAAVAGVAAMDDCKDDDAADIVAIVEDATNGETEEEEAEEKEDEAEPSIAAGQSIQCISTRIGT